MSEDKKNIINKKQKILCISPHPDDIEFGCGGTVHKLIQKGCDITFFAMSNCENSLVHNTNKDLMKELNASCAVLGVEKIKTFDFSVRNLWRNQTEICNLFYNTNNTLNPDIVFCPASSDIHQDHKIIYECASRIFKMKTLLGYELPWNCFKFKPDLYVVLDEENVQKKTESISKYKTQKSKIYSSPEYTQGTLKFRGHQIGEEYAEAFEVIRMVVKI
ncbi:LmbE family protein [Candidatus Pacearchaeota archaeon]|nr:LmbE family protein [Candidatus Pacearchaeota archaeon]|tara:strand:- start:1565 stop:2218 length:654 start_codon:yes stop_codon:yes gene_type:complete